MSWKEFLSLTNFDRDCLYSALERCIDLHRSDPPPGQERKGS